MKIAVILGTTRIGRQSEKVANELVARLKTQDNVEVEFLDIAQYPFPVFEERVRLHPNPPKELINFSNYLNNAEGIIFVIVRGCKNVIEGEEFDVDLKAAEIYIDYYLK